MNFSGSLSLSDTAWFQRSSVAEVQPVNEKKLLQEWRKFRLRKTYFRNKIFKPKQEVVTENKWEKSIESNKKMIIRF